jgi:hypothetical protein
MKRILVVACIFGTAAFGASVFLGLIVVFKAQSTGTYAFSGIGALMILALMLNTQDIMKLTDAIHRIMRGFWVMAFFLSPYLIYLASCRHIIEGKSLLEEPISIDWYSIYHADSMQLMAIYISIIFLMASPIGLSYLWTIHFTENEDIPVKPPAKSWQSSPPRERKKTWNSPIKPVDEDGLPVDPP